MKGFFKSVLKHIDRLDAAKLREQYRRVTDEFEFVNTLLGALDRGVVALDKFGETTYANPAALELLGKDLKNAFARLAILPGKTAKIETEIEYPERRPLEIRTLPVADGGTLVYIRDLSAEKARSEEELRVGATKAVCDLAAGVAHEIGNPLNAISMNLQLLERDSSDKESIATCISQVKRLDGIIREFLAALRPMKPNLAPGTPTEPLKRCLAALKQQLVERNIKITLDIPSALPSAAIDGLQIEQVFFNLLKNALEAIPDGGAIHITVASDDSDITTVIEDNGPGIAPDDLAHLFEPYRTTKEKGTGLGLMISARIVREHGGSISAESEVGKGTSFIVKLPRIEKRVRALK